MENAHLRLGLLEYVRMTEKASTRIRLRVDRYIGEDRQAHLLSVFGNDSDVGAITAAVHEKAAFSLTFPDGTTKDVPRRTCLLLQRSSDFAGPEASCASFAGGVPGTPHQWERGADDPVAVPARGGLGHTGELPWAACRSNMGRAHPWDRRGKEEDRGDRRHWLPAGTNLRNDRGDA
jgi:hypothetical protein